MNVSAAELGEWVEDLTRVKTGLTLSIQDKVEFITPSISTLFMRMKNPLEKDGIEPPSIVLSSDASDLRKLASLIALPGKEDVVLKLFLAATTSQQGRFSFPLTETFFTFVDPKRVIERFFGHKHHQLKISTRLLQLSPIAKHNLLQQLEPFFSRDNLMILNEKIDQVPFLDLENELLPSFAQKAVKKFSYFTGPNCFHAALAFQDPNIPKLPYFNPKREAEHHWQMINFDELWRVLRNSFYEIVPEVSDLKYGDLLVFFERPQEESSPQEVDFRRIRHVAVYLFNNYTFSKGSKSANSTYTVNLLEDEWKKWKRRTKNMAIKIFRKSGKRVTTLPHEDLHEWLY
ncbi:MAG: hypothetical protein HYW48_04620 [Deltaproteobacteria bacterium]|nr:hypothetical protein [Deltaproteobacteria bacterium]